MVIILPEEECTPEAKLRYIIIIHDTPGTMTMEKQYMYSIYLASCHIGSKPECLAIDVALATLATCIRA